MTETLENAPPDSSPVGRETADPLPLIRRLLLAVLLFGMVGTVVELLLLGHTEETQQWIPLGVLGIGLVSTLILTIRPTRRAVVAFRLTMVLFVVASLAGLYFHYRGNVEFELEMYPSITGLELFHKAVTGATPALAPGTLAWFGLAGLATTWRHEAMRR